MSCYRVAGRLLIVDAFNDGSEDFAVMPFQGFSIRIVFRFLGQHDRAARELLKGLVPAGANRCRRCNDRVLWRKGKCASIE